MPRRFGLEESLSAGSPRRWAGRWRPGGRTIAAIVVAAIVVVGGRLGLDHLLAAHVGREAVESGGERALLHAGGGSARITCPGGLEKTTGAKIVCAYTDVIAETISVATLLDRAPPPKVGRIEIRISGFRTRFSPLGSTSEAKFAVRVIQRPR
jgi:hypothetical protein